MINLKEASVVTFDGKTYPTSGYCVVLAGGAGSGKGFIQNNNIAIDAKVIDVDQLKQLYVRAINRTGTKLSRLATKKNYDFANADDVTQLHNIIDQGGEIPSDKGGFDTRYKKAIGRGISTYNELPNLLFDTTGKTKESLLKPVTMCKELGYKMVYVWIVTNREEAMIRNASRARRVGDAIFHDIHNKVNTNNIDFLTTDAANYFDDAWLLFASNDHVGGTQAERDWRLDNMAFQLPKRGSAFVISDSLMKRLKRTLGPNEPNPQNPEVYVDQGEVIDYLNTNGRKYSDVRDYGRNFRR